MWSSQTKQPLDDYPHVGEIVRAACSILLVLTLESLDFRRFLVEKMLNEPVADRVFLNDSLSFFLGVQDFAIAQCVYKPRSDVGALKAESL